jgi:uridine kinase
MRIKSKVEKQMMVTFNEEDDDQEEVHDSGPKIVILEGIFTLDEIDPG